jgi:dihydroxyacid dehydratase/phosphogluconate dehydratase
MANQSTETVSIEQIGRAIQRCSDAHPEYALRQRLHPDAGLLCEALAEMNWRKLKVVERSAFQDEHLEALLRWIG